MKTPAFVIIILIGLSMLSVPLTVQAQQKAKEKFLPASRHDPLLIRDMFTDTHSYRTGDTLTVTIRVDERCHLDLTAIRPDGSTTDLIIDEPLRQGQQYFSFPIRSTLNGTWELQAFCGNTERHAEHTVAFTLGTADSLARALAFDFWGNKTMYKIGEKATFTIQANQDCYLSLYSINSDGRIRKIFPNQFESNNFVVGGTTQQIPADDRFYFVTERPVVEVVYAICTNERYGFLEQEHRTPEEFVRTLEQKIQSLPASAWAIQEVTYGVMESEPKATSTVCNERCHKDGLYGLMQVGAEHYIPECFRNPSVGTCAASALRALGNYAIRQIDPTGWIRRIRATISNIQLVGKIWAEIDAWNTCVTNCAEYNF